MKKIALILVMASFGVLGVSAQTSKQIGMKKAKEIALQQATGKIKHSKFEAENGKSVYLFEIRDNKNELTKVKIDAQTGNVLDTKTETVAANKLRKKHWWIF